MKIWIRFLKMKMKNKKSQAVAEFMYSYGWAILAAVIAIGVLAYFGVFTPNYLRINENCLAKKFCKNYNGEFVDLSLVDEDIFCKIKLDTNYFELKFVDINFTELENKYPECRNE